MNRFRLPVFAMSLLAVLSLAACATTPGATKDDKKVVERSEARWEALFAKEYQAAYEFYSPGFRSSMSPTDFEISMRLRRVKWVSAKYLDHECGEDTCSVRFRLGYQVHNAVPGVKTWNSFNNIEEQWVKTRGEWWFLPEE